MSRVRILVQGSVREREAFLAYMKGVTSHIEETEPGTLVMEVYADPESGVAVLDEQYSDADSFLSHSATLMKGEQLEKFLEVFEFKRMTFLSGTEDERVAKIAEQFGAITASQVAGFTRIGG